MSQRKQPDVHEDEAGDPDDAIFRQIFEAAPAPFLVVDADNFRIVAANDAYLEAVVARREDLIGKHIFEAFPDPDPTAPEGSRNIGGSIERAKLTGKPDVLPVQHYPVPRRDGGFEDRYWSPVHAPVFDSRGRVRYVIQRPENVTELILLKDQADQTDAERRELTQRTRQMEADILQRSAELRRVNEHLKMAQRVAAIGSWEFRPDARESRRYSDEIYRIFGYTHERPPESTGWAMDAICEEDKPAAEALRDALLHGTDVEPATFRICTPAGELRYIQVRARFERDSSGNVIMIYGTLQDITEQKETEEALRLSEERFRLVAMATADTVFDWRVVDDAVWWSDGLQTIFGYEPAEHTTSESIWANFVHPDDRDQMQASLQRAIAEGDDELREECRFLRSGGEVAHVTLRAFLVRNNAGEVTRIVGSVNDVTLHLRYEEKLREQAELLNKARDAIIVHGLDHRIRYWSKGAERIFQWQSGDTVGRSMVSLLCKEPGAYIDAVNATIKKGEWSGRILQKRKDGSTLTIDGTWSLMTDEDGNPDAILAINTNVSDRVLLEEQLRQSQRLEAVGQLTGGIAHDFNNLLTIILGNAELMMEPETELAEIPELAELVRDTAQRGSDLTQRLLAFARQQYLQPRIVDVNELINGMEKLLQRTLLEHTKVEIIYQEDVWPTYVDPARLEAAILNLAINARDAMNSGGNLIIETANVQLDETYGTDAPEVAPGSYVVIAVSDTGTGIDPENLDKVFDPFFTTKEKGKGTGLGLSMTYGFVKQSNGNITIDSEPGQGTTVKLYLPMAAEAEDVAEDSTPRADELRGDECILVVEDDEQVRRLAVRHLERLGYGVLTAHDGPSALDIIRENDSIDLLFTDVIMSGGMNGRELTLRARELRPGLPVIYTSGYTEKVLAHQPGMDNEEEIELLQKPYRRPELARRVHAALHRSADGGSRP